jgi:hypothetical protein
LRLGSEEGVFESTTPMVGKTANWSSPTAFFLINP